MGSAGRMHGSRCFSCIGIKQGSQISVTPGQEINIIVGKGGAGLYYGYPEKGGFSQFMNSSYRAEGGNPSGNGLLNGENSTGGPYTGGNGGSGGSVDQSGDEFYAGSDGSDAPGITDGNGIYHPPGTKYGGGKGQGYTTRDFGEPTGKRNAGGGGADRNRDGGMGGESDYDEGCGIGRGNRKSGGYGGGGCGSEGTGGDGTVLIRGKRDKSYVDVMRRRFENVNMAMGNCFSPVMEGSQFQWNNIVVNSPVYITPIRRKKFKISFGEFDLSKVLSNVSSNCDIIIRDKSAYTFLLLLLSADHSKCSLFNNHLTVNTQDLPRYIFHIDSKHEELYSYKDGVLESNVTIMAPVDDYFYNYIDIQIRNFNDNPIPDFYVGVVDNIGN